jgi:hypothetical protein
LKPHRTGTFKVSKDAAFAEKVADIEAYSAGLFVSASRRVDMKDGPFCSRIELPHTVLEKKRTVNRVLYHRLVTGTDHGSVRGDPP